LHSESLTGRHETGFVILDVERSGTIQIYSRTGMDSTHRDGPEGRLLRWIVALQGIVQRLGNERPYVKTTGCGCLAYLLAKLVFERDRDAHDAHH